MSTKNSKKSSPMSKNTKEKRPNSVPKKKKVNNPKKDASSIKKRRRQNAPIFKFEHVRRNMQETSTEDLYTCKLCPGASFTFKNFRKHLTSTTHSENAQDSEDYLELLQYLVPEEEIESNDRETKKDKEGLLSFINLCVSIDLSIRQISLLSKGLKSMVIQKKMGFMAKANFNEHSLSNAINSMGVYYKEKLAEDLLNSKFSISIDTSTISKTQICAIKARYLKDYPKESEISNPKIALENKILGLKYLSDSSDGQSMFTAVQEKVYELKEGIKENLVGITCDHASSMTGARMGLISRLQEDAGERFIFSLEDPCHSFNLALKHSMDSIPSEITNFIDELHHHFTSTQRTSALYKKQEEIKMKKKGLCYYVKTRWLSLGLSLTRMLEIWESLVKYMESKPAYSGLKKFDSNKFLWLLNDPNFKIKLVFLEAILKKINSFSIKYQNQRLEINKLRQEMFNCVRELLEIFIKSSVIPKDLSKLKEYKQFPWEVEKTKQEYLRDDEDLIRQFELELSPVLKYIHSIKDAEIKTDILEFCRNYFKSLIFWLIKYLPLDDKFMELFDFVCFDIEKEEIKKKVLAFNSKFNVTRDLNAISLEINNLYSKRIDWARSDSSLQFWAWIESTYVKSEPKSDIVVELFPILSKIVRIAHVLPVSSAGIEQSFSTLKLIKSSIRSRLKESTLESLILIKQNYSPFEEFKATDRLIEIYEFNKPKYTVPKKEVTIKAKSPPATQEMPNLEEKKEQEVQLLRKNKRKSLSTLVPSQMKNIKITEPEVPQEIDYDKLIDKEEEEREEEEEEYFYDDEEDFINSFGNGDPEIKDNEENIQENH